MALELVPSSDALGAEVRGLDPRLPVSDQDRQLLIAAWREHLVLILRGHALTDAQLVAFCGVFGELDPPGPNPYGAPFLSDFPELNVISNVVADGKAIGGLGAGEAVWHADMTYQDVPPQSRSASCSRSTRQRGDGRLRDDRRDGGARSRGPRAPRA